MWGGDRTPGKGTGVCKGQMEQQSASPRGSPAAPADQTVWLAALLLSTGDSLCPPAIKSIS